MANFLKFANVNGVEVMLYPGNMSVEPTLLFKDEDEFVKMTLDSNIYENELGEFMFHEGLSDQRKVVAERIMNELASNVEQLTYVRMFTLKPAYKDKLMKVINELIETKEYYNI